MNKFKLILPWLIFSLMVAQVGCSSKIKLSQPAYEVAMGLLNCCARKDAAALGKLRSSLEPHQGGEKVLEMTDDEKSLLLSIVKQAEDAQWDKASDRVRKLLEYQASKNLENSPAQRHQHR